MGKKKKKKKAPVWCDRMHWLAGRDGDFGYRFRAPASHYGQLTTTEIIGQVQEAVGVGQPHVAVDELPPAYRQLFQDPDFHFIGGRVFKKRDPINDAKDGNAGRDLLDADEDELEALEEKFKDRPEVVAFLHENPDVFLEPVRAEDAMNFADNGLQDVRGKHPGAQGSDEWFVSEKEQAPIGLFDLIDRDNPILQATYIPPRDRYQFCTGNERQYWSEAKARRDEVFGDLRAEAADLEDEEQVRAFLDNIREDYYNDKQIRRLWNHESFLIDRWIYADSLRRQGFDEETIRRKLWAAFDRVEGRIPTVIEDGKVIRRGRRIPPSFWQKARTRALQEVTLTYTQWSQIYAIVRGRREWARTEGSKHTALGLMNLINGRTRKCPACGITILNSKGKCTGCESTLPAMTQQDLHKIHTLIQEKEKFLNTFDTQTVWRVFSIKSAALSWRKRNIQRRARYEAQKETQAVR
jgi:hypothetical protein